MIGCIWVKFAHPQDENIKVYVYCASVLIGKVYEQMTMYALTY